MIHPRPNVFCLFLILLISCSDVAASIVTDETNSGVTPFVAEITSMCGLRWDGMLPSTVYTIFLCFHNNFYVVSRHSLSLCRQLQCRQLHVDSFHIWDAHIICNEIIL